MSDLGTQKSDTQPPWQQILIPPTHQPLCQIFLLCFPARGTGSSSAWVIAITATAEPLYCDCHSQELMGSEYYQHPSSHCRAAPQHQVRCHPAQKGGCWGRAAWSIHISINPKPKPCLEAQCGDVQNSWSLFYRQCVKASNLGCKIPARYTSVPKHTFPSARTSQVLTTRLFSDENTLKAYF